MERVSFENGKGMELAGVLYRPEAGSKSAVILCHGFKRDKNVDICVELCKSLSNEGVLALRFDFTGSGESEGDLEDFSVQQEVNDLESALRYIESLGSEKIGIAGVSMGGMVCLIEASRNTSINVVAVFSPAINREKVFESYRKQGRMREEGEYVFVDNFRFKRKAIESSAVNLFGMESKIKAPILFVHGTADARCSFEDSQKFFSGVRVEKDFLVLDGAGHGYNDNELKKAVDAATEWFKRWLK